MPIAFAVLLALTAASAATPAQADPYRWCANYTGEGGNGTNCYFLTLEQCRWTVSGAGGSCTPNPFYTGAGERPARTRRR